MARSRRSDFQTTKRRIRHLQVLVDQLIADDVNGITGPGSGDKSGGGGGGGRALSMSGGSKNKQQQQQTGRGASLSTSNKRGRKQQQPQTTATTTGGEGFAYGGDHNTTATNHALTHRDVVAADYAEDAARGVKALRREVGTCVHVIDLVWEFQLR